MSNLVWFKDEKRGITGRIYVGRISADDPERFSTMCYVCQPADIRYVAEAASQALGFPVEISSMILFSGYYRIEFLRVSSEELALREKIAAHQAVEYWFVPRCKLMGVMAEDLGQAILHKYTGVLDGDFDVATWVVDVSGVSPALLAKWVDQAIEIVFETLRASFHEVNCYEAYATLMIASSRNPEYRTAEVAALGAIYKDQRCSPVEAREEIISLCRTRGVEFSRELQKAFEGRLSGLFRGWTLDVREILRSRLDDGVSGGREGNPELAEIERSL